MADVVYRSLQYLRDDDRHERRERRAEVRRFGAEPAQSIKGRPTKKDGRQLRTLHRPANLEDLFLKLTGRQIREEG